jgi:sulfhydrogenase subunit beta (sulfur reductase)
MLNSLYTITKSDLFDLFSRLAQESRIFVPYEYNDKFYFGKFDPAKEASIVLGGIRQNEPFKSFLNPAREKILGKSSQDTRPVIVAGVKQCDLSSFVLQDFVFLKGDHEDPLYSFHRNNTLIISSDCTFARETCFCIAMDGRPYPAVSFDLNLSPLDNKFLVESGSEKGNSLVKGYKTFFRDVRTNEIDKRDEAREAVSDQVREFIKKRGTPGTPEIRGSVKKHYDNLAMWQDHSSTCVECGACNLVCPTCHCFQLFDTKTATQTMRGRVWDACLYKTFARVAGGANPRKHLYERLRNRFDKKFAFFPEVLNYFACTGCGRCIDACPGDIDLREVLKGLVSGAWKKPPHD